MATLFHFPRGKKNTSGKSSATRLVFKHFLQLMPNMNRHQQIFTKEKERNAKKNKTVHPCACYLKHLVSLFKGRLNETHTVVFISQSSARYTKRASAYQLHPKQTHCLDKHIIFNQHIDASFLLSDRSSQRGPDEGKYVAY